MTEWKWDMEACEFIDQRCRELSDTLRKAEARLRKNPDFKILRKAEQEKNQLSQQYAYQTVREERIRKFSLEHKPKRIYKTNYEIDGICHPEIKEGVYMDLIEYLNRKTKQPVQIYGFMYNVSRGLGLQVFQAREKSIQTVEKELREAEKNKKRFYPDKKETLFYDFSDAYDEEDKLTWQRLIGRE